MAWMTWRPEIPDPESLWEEWDRIYDQQKDEAVLQRSIALAEHRTEQRKENHAKLVSRPVDGHRSRGRR
jgi:hypothetical protein